MTTKPEKTPEERDEEELREIESKIKEVMELMAKGHKRDEVDKRLSDARLRRDAHHGDKTSAYHIASSGHVPTTRHTESKIALAEQLKLRIQLGQYARNLDDTLERLSARHVDVLERILKRSRY
jgi:3-mercaptopyruvate sulfurtransferase SseA